MEGQLLIESGKVPKIVNVSADVSLSGPDGKCFLLGIVFRNIATNDTVADGYFTFVVCYLRVANRGCSEAMIFANVTDRQCRLLSCSPSLGHQDTAKEHQDICSINL